MSELIVASRLLIESDYKYVYMSRVGVTCLNSHNQLVSFVLDPKESSYTVKVQEEIQNNMHMMVSHVFVGRYLEWLKAKEPFQIWRWHVDVYPAGEDAPMVYCHQVDTALRGDQIFRSSFEHVAGPDLANPSLLGMLFAADGVDTAMCMRNLVPERQAYRDNCDEVYHPGLTTVGMGILGQYDLLAQKPMQAQKWVM